MHDPLLAMFVAVILEGDASPTYNSILNDHFKLIAASHHDAFLHCLIALAQSQLQQGLTALLQPFKPQSTVGVSFIM